MPATAASLPGATDTHVHVFDPARFAFAVARSYTPGPASAAALRECHAQLGIGRAVLVQPSVYGTDNGCMLDAIAQLGQHRCRGIAVVDLERVSRDELLALHAAGVRGVRLNLEVRHESDPARVLAELQRAAAVVDLPGWCVQIHCAASLLPVVAQALQGFRVPLVLDHFGGLRAGDADTLQPPLRTLLALLATDRVWLKLSAFYRASSDATRHAGLAPLARTLIQARAGRLLWGSDWPHTGGGNRDRDPARIEPFRTVDLPASLAALRSWAPDAAVLHRILVGNPAELYGFSADAAA
ncbi:amidohydrolase family protein [Azohydromonas lata]|uniref:Amidohydrolase family protein n=1 Tax=Azohydromonas lata TaxID=45677 RepID=A0ABU5IHA5_9BURK|nr:amidohydrolase family protein [Azohydromonas lata]MDZ5458449.1 amidohydrolase family protein [Azohydromonas lata]